MARASNDGRAMCSAFTCPDRDDLPRVVGRFLAHFVVIVIFRDHSQHAFVHVGARRNGMNCTKMWEIEI